MAARIAVGFAILVFILVGLVACSEYHEGDTYENKYIWVDVRPWSDAPPDIECKGLMWPGSVRPEYVECFRNHNQ